MKIKQRRFAAYVQTDVTQFNVAAGAAGYVDTDCSALSTNPNLVWLIQAKGDGNWTTVGARPHGSAIDPKCPAVGTLLMSKLDATGHCDLYRDAAVANEYRFVGYFG